jgi:hypothetical protein
LQYVVIPPPKECGTDFHNVIANGRGPWHECTLILGSCPHDIICRVYCFPVPSLGMYTSFCLGTVSGCLLGLQCELRSDFKSCVA